MHAQTAYHTARETECQLLQSRSYDDLEEVPCVEQARSLQTYVVVPIALSVVFTAEISAPVSCNVRFSGQLHAKRFLIIGSSPICQISLGWKKNINASRKPTKSPAQGQPNPRKIRLKSGIWVPFFFPQPIFFSWVGIGFYGKQTARYLTQPNHPQTPH